jgi:hypothetical protein
MIRKICLALLFLALAVPASACAHTERTGLVDVRVVSDHGGEFPKYRTYPRLRDKGTYFYVEAAKGQRYSVQVANRSERRIGVVVAIDGRNIIDGKKSILQRTERMYILGPYETNTFEGWRTAIDRTNRFYFTQQSDSYAEKVFSDGSAMGTIAVAVYRENLPEPIPYLDNSSREPYNRPYGLNEAPAGAAPSASVESRSHDRAGKKSEQAGTGFGETTYSPVRVVVFEPERAAVEKIVLKYEWRSELCRKGIIGCEPTNRFWPDAGEFAPVPKDFRG